MTRDKVRVIIIFVVVIGLNFAFILWLYRDPPPYLSEVLPKAGMYGLLFAGGNVVGFTSNWLGRKSGTKVGLVCSLFVGASLSFVGMWLFFSIRGPSFAEPLAVYLIGYLFSSFNAGMSSGSRNKELPPSPIPEDRTFILGLGIALGLLVLCSLFRIVDLFVVWVIELGLILPVSLYILYNGKKQAEYAQKRQQAIEQNPQLIALFRQLGDGIEYDSVKCRASFASRASVEAFQQSATGWEVELKEKKQ
jgi:hypothetical protein